MKQYSELNSLLNRLGVVSDSLILVHESETVSKLTSRDYLSFLQSRVDQGTLAIMGDCLLNTQAASKDPLTTQERLVLSSGPMLQLLTLQSECFYVAHPALMIASVGKYARYLARSRDLDFPYGSDSVFNDLYGMNAVILFIGDNHKVPEMKYALSKIDKGLIAKEVSFSGKDLVTYLDLDFDFQALTKELFQSGLLLSEETEEGKIYGIHYKDLFVYLNEKLV